MLDASWLCPVCSEPKGKLSKLGTSIKQLETEIDDLQETIDEATSILEDAFVPEASREDLALAVRDALDVLAGEEEVEEDESDTSGEE